MTNDKNNIQGWLKKESGKTLLWDQRGILPVKWITHHTEPFSPCVMAFRRHFICAVEEKICFYVSADERYELFLDGERIGCGPEYGDRENWFLEKYEFSVSAGKHVLVAKVWALGDMSPYAQFSIRPGFILLPSPQHIDLLGTGLTDWDSKIVHGYGFSNSPLPTVVGATVQINGDLYPWGIEFGEGEDWTRALVLDNGRLAEVSNEISYNTHLLKEATLPPMIHRDIKNFTIRYIDKIVSDENRNDKIDLHSCLDDEILLWSGLHNKKPVVIPAHTTRRLIIDFNDYYCAYPILTATGGINSSISLKWAESFFEKKDCLGPKGNRDHIEGKYFIGIGDTFLIEGGNNRCYSSLWWRAGRYVEVIIQTEEDPLTIESLNFKETRYPLEMESEFFSSNETLNSIIKPSLRALQMCSHEIFMDCPYYEQLMYIGDARLEALNTYAINTDDRLPRKALRLFNDSRVNSGCTQSRYPSRVRQIIPGFSLWWIGMVYDYALWRDDKNFVKSLLPGVHAIIDMYSTYFKLNGLIENPSGWNFVDWVESWEEGIPDGGDFGISGIHNWQFVYALRCAAELENWIGEKELVTLYMRKASQLTENIYAHFWDESKGLFADTMDKSSFSEHSQILAILSGMLSKEYFEKVSFGLATDVNLIRTTIYFAHYLFEAYKLIGRVDLLLGRIGDWFCFEENGLFTTPERPEPSRSDCHGWGAHPLYHLFATILGIRPAEFGFKSVVIEPQLSLLNWANGTLVHPKGLIESKFCFRDDKIIAKIKLPEYLEGELIYNKKTYSLKQNYTELIIENNENIVPVDSFASMVEI